MVGSTALEKYHRKFAFDSDPNGYFFEEDGCDLAGNISSLLCLYCVAGDRLAGLLDWRGAMGASDQGGGHIGALPPNGRVVAAFSIPILALMAAGIASAASLYPHWAPWTGLVAVTVQTVVTTLNWMTPSKPERLLWAPITFIMLLLASYVVLSAY